MKLHQENFYFKSGKINLKKVNMKISAKQLIYFLICSVIMYLPRRWFVFGIQSYRLVLLLLLFTQIQRLRFSKSFFNIFTILYISYISIYYFCKSGILSYMGFVIDTVGIFILIYSVIDTKKDFEIFLSIFIKCVVAYSVFCIIQTFTEFNIFDVIAGVKSGVALTSVYYRFGLVRSYGSFTTSINNALFLVMASHITLFQMDQEEKKNRRKKYFWYYLIIVAAICSTLSRAPILILLITLLGYLVKKGLSKFVVRHLLKIITTLIVVSIIISSSSIVRNSTLNFVNMFYAIFDDSTSLSYSSSFGVNANGLGERVLLYDWVQEEIKGNELLGVGPDADIVFKFKDEWDKDRTKTSIENQYLKTLSYFGFLGLALYIAFGFKMLFYTISRSMKNKSMNFYHTSYIIQLAYLICILSVSSVDDMRMYFAVLALTHLYDKNVHQNNENLLIERGELA